MLGDEIDELVVRVRADTGGFMAGLGDIRRELDGPFAAGIERAGGGLERALARAAVTGKLGFDDLKRVALTALSDIAASALRLDLSALGGGGGLIGGLTGLVGGLLGVPGRATGGPVTAGRAYRVGERGPELFVPTASGRIEASGSGGGRAVSITVNVAAPRDASRDVMRQTGDQVARAVARTLARIDG